MAGFVYIMSNPSFTDGPIKIGKSDRDPEEFRKSELNSTGVPEPFKVEYSAYVQNHHELELTLHQHFAAQRPNKNREFFTCSIMDAISAIQNKAGNTLKHEDNYYADYEEKQEEARFEEHLKGLKGKRGWIYIADNKDMPGLLKVGSNTNSDPPTARTTELEDAGSPHSFKIHYEAFVDDVYQLTMVAHKDLSDLHESKDWFRTSVNNAVSVIRPLVEKQVSDRWLSEEVRYIEKKREKGKRLSTYEEGLVRKYEEQQKN